MPKRIPKWVKKHQFTIGYGILVVGILIAIGGLVRYQYKGCVAGNQVREANRLIYRSFEDQLLADPKRTPEQQANVIRFFNLAMGVPSDLIDQRNADWKHQGRMADRSCYQL